MMMNKKYFTRMVIIGSLLLFSVLPIINYLVDFSRTLHHDYHARYEKYHFHELFLKVAYLIDHKNSYDTLVFGSSRGGFMDVKRISKNAYDMSHGFGTISTSLHSLKSILDNNVSVKHVWLGINDFDIWKDHTDELYKLIYHNNILKDSRLYAHWLFRFIPQSVQVIKQHMPLVETQEVTNPESKVNFGRKKAKSLKTSHRHIAAATLGYTGKFRIDAAIKELQELKKLCDDHHITLTAFMYPSYYKTFLRYDQKQIERFKRKLTSVLDFYDFYDLKQIALEDKNWFEGSHFTPSVGDYIIRHIQQKDFLVTAKNIDAHIKQTQAYMKHLGRLPAIDIYSVNNNIDFSMYPLIFDLHDKNFSYQKNDDFVLKKYANSLLAYVDGPDPMFVLDHTKTNLKHVVLSVSIQSPKKTLFSLYLKKHMSDAYAENYKHNIHLQKGLNTFKLILPSPYINNQLRVDFVNHTGIYKIKQFTLRAF